MKSEQEDDLALSFERGLKGDTGEAAKRHLEAGLSSVNYFVR